MKEAILLMTMGLYVGGVNIQRDLFRRGIMAVEKDISEQVGQLLQVWYHLVITGVSGLAGMFQPVEGGFSGQSYWGFIF